MEVHCREPRGARSWGIQFISDRGTEEGWGIREAYERATQGYRQQTSEHLPTRHSDFVFKKINLCEERLARETFYLSNTQTSEKMQAARYYAAYDFTAKATMVVAGVYKTTFLGGKTQEMFPVGVGVNNMCFLLTCGFFGAS